MNCLGDLKPASEQLRRRARLTHLNSVAGTEGDAKVGPARKMEYCIPAEHQKIPSLRLLIVPKQVADIKKGRKKG